MNTVLAASVAIQMAQCLLISKSNLLRIKRPRAVPIRHIHPDRPFPILNFMVSCV